MARDFTRKLVLAVGVFLVVAILAQTNWEFAAPVTEYVQFVVSTNFSFKPVLDKVGIIQKLEDWNLGAFKEAWPPVFGR